MADRNFLLLAERSGAVLTGKPNGSEAVSVLFTIAAWRAFDSMVAPIVSEYLAEYQAAVEYASWQIWASMQRKEGNPCWSYDTSDERNGEFHT
jgi:hypothetical protein